VSNHRYIPNPELDPTLNPPQDCSVPNCDCKLYRGRGWNPMTKERALQQFNQLCPRLSFMKTFTNDKTQLDTVARDEAWSNWTSSLYEEGKITKKQYETWTNPWR
jgi:hypothetical protein